MHVGGLQTSSMGADEYCQGDNSSQFCHRRQYDQFLKLGVPYHNNKRVVNVESEGTVKSSLRN